MPALPLANNRHRTPFILLALAAGMLVNFLPIFLPFLGGLPISFLGWALPLAGCGSYLLLRPRKITFPLGIWLPWVIWVLVYLLLAEAANALQRSLMLLTPLVVGTAFSTIRVDTVFLKQCKRWLQFFVFIYFTSNVIAMANIAASVITSSLLATWMAAGYAMQYRLRDLLVWAMLSLVPVIAVTRMGILAVGITLPTTLAPLSLKRRLVIVSVLAFAGLAVFQLERVQEKMFISGQGTLEQAIESSLAMLAGRDDLGSDDFRTNARKAMAQMLRAHVQEAYWLGNGANAVEEITSRYFDGLTHPHNDWLRLQHDYGTLGMLIFALAMLMQTWSAWRVARQLEGEAARFMYAAASAFIPMALFMLTDNVILYVAWFGNLHFAMLGIGYAALRSKKTGPL